MATDGDDRNPVERLAEEFLARRRRGEPADPEEYARAHPELADEILKRFPSLLLREDLGGDAGARTVSVAGGVDAVVGVAAGRLGDFRLLREIGRGGMGVVYEAEQESLGRRVALKVLTAAALGDRRHVERFVREARSAGRLHHTHIVPVFGVGEHEGTHFYVMQFIQGQGLDAVLNELKKLRNAVGAKEPGPTRVGPIASQRAAADIAQSLAAGRFVAAEPAADETTFHRSPSPAGEGGPAVGDANSSTATVPANVSAFSQTDRGFVMGVARIGVQVAEALAYAHGQGILHRDIKPSNLLLDRDGSVWVADFGLAKAAGADDLTHTGDIVGTVRYMSPERFRGEGDGRADLYALGLTLYELLALRPAFDESDRAALIRQVTQEDAPRLRRLSPKVPPDLETIIHKAIAREPARRYATAGALADDLTRFLEGRPIQARRVSAAERTWRWCRRNPVVAALLVLLAVSLVGMAGLWLRSERLLAVARRQATGLQLEHVIGACERGDLGRGLAGLAELLTANASAPAEEQYPIRANLAAWSERGLLPEVLATGVIRIGDVGGDRVRGIGEFSDAARRGDLWTLGEDGRVQLWDVATGRPSGVPIGPVASGPVASESSNGPSPLEISFTGDGKSVLVSDRERQSFRLWDLATGRPGGPEIRNPWPGFSPRPGPDGRHVAGYGVGGDPEGQQAYRWDAVTGLPTGGPWRWELPDKSSTRGALAGDEDLLLLPRAGGRFELWDLVRGERVGEPLECPGLRYAWFIPGRSALLTGELIPGRPTTLTADTVTRLRLWDTRTGRPLGPAWGDELRLDFSNLINFHLLADLTAAFLAGDRVEFRDLATGQPRGEPIPVGSGVMAVSLFPTDRTKLVTTAAAVNAKEFRVWDLATRQAIGQPIRPQSWSVRLWVNKTTTRLASFSSLDSSLEMWDLASGQRLARLGPVEVIGGVTADGSSVMGYNAADKILRRWDLTRSRPGWTRLDALELAALLEAGDRRSPRYRVNTGKDTTSSGLQLVDDQTGETRTLGGPAFRLNSPATATAIGPHDDLVLTGSADGTTRLWSIATGAQVGPSMMSPGQVNSVAFAPDAKTIVIATGRAVRLWDLTFGRPIGPPMEHPVPIMAAHFSPDGRWILAMSRQQPGAYRWPMPTPVPGPPAAVLERIKRRTGSGSIATNSAR